VFQTDYIDRCLARFDLTNCREKDQLEKFVPTEGGKKASLQLVQEMLGCLQYLACKSRPDIVCITNRLSQEVTRPNQHLQSCIVNVWRYLKSTKRFSLALGDIDKEGDLIISVDASFGKERDRKSTRLNS